MTGDDTKEKMNRIMEAGADGYVAKPVLMNTLLQHIENLLNNT
jgi:DNA-binding NarL/FixJ family response regulator